MKHLKPCALKTAALFGLTIGIYTVVLAVDSEQIAIDTTSYAGKAVVRDVGQCKNDTLVKSYQPIFIDCDRNSKFYDWLIVSIDSFWTAGREFKLIENSLSV
jgi:hypothetical protein